MENESNQKPVVEWWQSKAARPELEGCVARLNEAQDTLDPVHRFSTYVQALNLLWSGKARLDNDRERSDSQGIRDILLSIPASRQEELCNKPEVLVLANLVPQILNVDCLRASEHYIPGKTIPHKLARAASTEHRQFATAIQMWHRDHNADSCSLVMKRLAALLYVVRSNIAHGEKTLNGRDIAKATRDRNVCEIALPVVLGVVNSLFNHPNQMLIAYGTLKPSEPNNEILETLNDQEWQDIEVEGQLINRKGGLKAFQWCNSGTRHKAMLLKSRQLASFWQRLDSFEGSAYRRILATALIDELAVVAMVYQ